VMRRVLPWVRGILEKVEAFDVVVVERCRSCRTRAPLRTLNTTRGTTHCSHLLRRGR
jgi:hypothetical protein